MSSLGWGGGDMRRRDFLGALAGGAAAWPIAARAQQSAMPMIGYLHMSEPDTYNPLVAAFRKGLSETGYVEGRNVTIEYRWAHNDAKRLPELAADLVRLRVAVIVTPVGTVAATVAKAATTTIPIVFSSGTDAVQAGLVTSFNRPGGNLTGISFMVSELGAKRLGLLLDLRPQLTRIGVLGNPNNPVAADTAIKDVRLAALAKGLDIEFVTASAPRDIETAFATLAQKRADGLVVTPDPLFSNRRIQLATYAARHAMPVVYPLREFAEAGGLMSYGPNNVERNRQIGIYVGRILNGEKPADMPVQRPTNFELVINLQTARALNIPVPQTLLASADAVIE